MRGGSGRAGKIGNQNKGIIREIIYLYPANDFPSPRAIFAFSPPHPIHTNPPKLLCAFDSSNRAMK